MHREGAGKLRKMRPEVFFFIGAYKGGDNMLVFQATIGKKLTPEEIAAAVKSKPVGIHLQASERWISTANNMNELSKALNAAAKQKNLPNETKTALNKALDYAAKVHEQIERMVPKTAETVSGTEFLPAREIKKL